ncbi:MAG: DUF4430 domain-containing protein [Eggerthellaceae bacterium]|nr:DUF4430 domain-containing protein [Eggerthellaceae bacterium]
MTKAHNTSDLEEQSGDIGQEVEANAVPLEEVSESAKAAGLLANEDLSSKEKAGISKKRGRIIALVAGALILAASAVGADAWHAGLFSHDKPSTLLSSVVVETPDSVDALQKDEAKASEGLEKKSETDEDKKSQKDASSNEHDDDRSEQDVSRDDSSVNAFSSESASSSDANTPSQKSSSSTTSTQSNSSSSRSSTTANTSSTSVTQPAPKQVAPKPFVVSVYVDGMGSLQVTLWEGATAYDALTATGAAVSTLSTGYGLYVNGINGRMAGGLSGWKYSVNGWEPNYSAAGYVLSNGDSVSWYWGSAR